MLHCDDTWFFLTLTALWTRVCLHVVQGYKAYVAILYTMTGMLFTALALCVWIAYSYKNRSFAYTW